MADNNVLHDESNIERLIRNILNHPTFQATVNQILHHANSNIRISTEESVDEVRGSIVRTHPPPLLKGLGPSKN